ncbi:MAG: TIGR04283 family arsenosugar biosynthesis glycosyltransferase [Planctomycetes bacterium]|nr:TIGR04283 family arsenosugar biosynthesis glycosyltransferase [Planctomycetota bacterium]
MPKVSIIIPTLQEENTIEKTLLNLRKQGNSHEVTVVDGGSTDSTVDIASRYARVIKGPPGRARQMNLGASHARGKILLFLHADTILPEGAVDKVCKAIQRPGIVGGCFSLAFDPPHSFLCFISLFTHLHWWWVPYGDQAFFATAEAFNTLGGYRDLAIMEDMEFFKRLKNLGKVCIIQDPVITSSRRFLKKGVYRQTLLNLLIYLGYLCGLKADRFKKWYGTVR